jgi:hypothetical protein
VLQAGDYRSREAVGAYYDIRIEVDCGFAELAGYQLIGDIIYIDYRIKPVGFLV